MKRKNYIIKPPPSDSCDQPLYRVVYEIDVNAPDEQYAAQTAWQMMRAKDAFDPILMVLDSEGKQTQLDLSDILKFNKVTVGFVSQKFRKQTDGTYKCIWQDFIAGDDVQYENVMGDKIEEPPHEYQPFYMTLLSTSQIISRLKDIITSIDAGSEQSKQFASEIKILTQLLNDLGSETRD